MTKLKTLDTKGLTPAIFDGVRSYEAALWTIGICNKLIERANAGDIIFSYENLVKPAFELRWSDSGRFEGLYLKDDENAWTQIVGDQRHDDVPVVHNGKIIGYTPGKIVCRKYETREFFKLWRTAKIVDVTKAVDLV